MLKDLQSIFGYLLWRVWSAPLYGIAKLLCAVLPEYINNEYTQQAYKRGVLDGIRQERKQHDKENN